LRERIQTRKQTDKKQENLSLEPPLRFAHASLVEDIVSQRRQSVYLLPRRFRKDVKNVPSKVGQFTFIEKVHPFPHTAMNGMNDLAEGLR
jgi:hypothetical protein